MEDQNKIAKDWYQITYRELANLMNQHWQMSNTVPDHPLLKPLARRIRIVAACCDLWKRVAESNATRRFFEGG